MRDIGEKCKERGLTWLHCPIPDFDGPGAAFERAWADAGERARAILRRGARREPLPRRHGPRARSPL